MGSYTHVDPAAKDKAVRLLKAGEIMIAEAAQLVGVSVQAVGRWVKGFEIRKARRDWVNRRWNEA